METDRPNPFFVLRLATNASKREIIEKAQELYDISASEEERQLYTWAKEQLITHPQKRLVYELFEYPDVRYDDQLFEQFVERYKNAPVPSAEQLLETATPLSLEHLNMVAVFQRLLQSLLEVPESEITTALAHIPFPVEVRSPLEVRDVIFG